MPESSSNRAAGSACEGASPLVAGRSALPAFFLIGLLFSFPGSILPAWGYNLTPAYSSIGLLFLAMGTGVVLSVPLARMLLVRWPLNQVMALACAVSCVALLLLSWFSPPASWWWQFGGLVLLGIGTGILNAAVFHFIWPFYLRDPAATLNLAGILFGLGCLMTALTVAIAYYTYTVGSMIGLISIFPAFGVVHFARARFSPQAEVTRPGIRQFFASFRNLTAILFMLLLFFQFGNEWSVAGWLAVFLSQRLGLSPDTSLYMLALYWLAILTGRILIQAILPSVSHARILLAGAGLAMFGCLVLRLTDNRFGAISGIIFVGAGFASIYPLTMERIRGRFPSYHPEFFHGVVTVAFAGGLLAAATLGFYAELFGIGVVMLLPLLGTCTVAILLLLIWLEAHLSGPGQAAPEKYTGSGPA
ncbi:MAG: hypothetical protein NTY38_12050 [Acidobacteria bacterium]|nr:hypothetical protein [Acidobacteriota bacterium]